MPDDRRKAMPRKSGRHTKDSGRKRLPIPAGAGSASIPIPRPPELPQVTGLGLVQVGPLWDQAPHHHPDHELHYVRRGRGTLVINGIAAGKVATGAAYLIRPQEAHGGTSDPRDPVQVLYLGLRLPSQLTTALAGSDPLLLVHDDSLELRAALRAICESLLEGGADAPPLPTLLLRTLAALSALADQRKRGARGGTNRERELAESVLRDLELHDQPPPPLRLLARRAGVTPAHLGRALLSASGKTFPQLAAEQRVRIAQRLLQDSTLPVREVAQRVGLSGPRALARLFKRMTGRQPSEYRSAAGS